MTKQTAPTNLTSFFPAVDPFYLKEVAADFAPARPTRVFATYWYFAAERQAIFFRRLACRPAPWSDDPILTYYKFTNAYRASDRVSQYLIRHVIYDGEKEPEEVVFRVLLFKIFNRIGTWQLLVRELGQVSFADYSFDRYDAVLTKAIEAGERLFAAAYIMPSGGRQFGHLRKHRNYLKLIEMMMNDQVPRRLIDIKDMRSAFNLLRVYPLLGDFLAYQFVIDLNYSSLTNFSEMEFVVPGPGARDGIRKCFADLGGLTEERIIRLMAERQEAEITRVGMDFHSLWGRPLQLIDCQNLFCELGKYARVAHPDVPGLSGRRRIKQRHQPQAEPISYWYPPRWGINDAVARTLEQYGNQKDRE
jgi:hypothetical protein